MRQYRRLFFTVSLTAAFSLAPAREARGGLLGSVAGGLGALGFDIAGGRSVLSGGLDLRAVNVFSFNNELDAGIADLALQGPMSFALTTGGRGLSELEFSVRTAVNPLSAATPLNYVFHVDAGNQSAQVSGSVLIDATFHLNGLGFYDANLTYSSRQTIDRDGRFADDTLTNDFDLGPIDISGNIYADLLAAVTEPFFAAIDRENPFTSFSGSAKFAQAVQSATAGPSGEPGYSPMDRMLIQAAAASIMDQVFHAALSDAGGRSFASNGSGFAAQRAVPEPATLVLLLMGLPALLHRRHTRAL